MPAGLIKHHDHVLILGDGGSEAVEELLHRLGVGIGHVEGEAVVGAGLDRREDVGDSKRFRTSGGRRRASTIWADPTLLADPRLVLEEQADALVFMCSCNSSQQRRGSFKGLLCGRVLFRVAGPRLLSRKPELAQTTHRGDVQALAEPLLANAHRSSRVKVERPLALRSRAVEHKAIKFGLLLGVEPRRPPAARAASPSRLSSL